MKKAYDSNIFVKSIPLEITEQEFREKFSQAGNIVSITLKQTPGKYTKAGYVLYESVAEAQKAIQKFHDTQFGSKISQVDFWMSK